MALAQLIPVMSASSLEAAQQAEKAAAEKRQSSPFIQSLAAHVRKRWELVRDKRSIIEERLQASLRQRNGEYEPDKLAAIKAQGGSEIYMNLTSVKCRGASSWLRDTLLGTGSEKPWNLYSTPIPELPPEIVQQVHADLTQLVQMFIMSYGEPPPPEMVRKQAEQMRDHTMGKLKAEADKRIERMELKMEDQLTEGRFADAFSQFIDDIVTFPTAIMKGPIVRNRKKLEWNGDLLESVDATALEWERVDPFKFYPAPWASNLQDSFVIERHQMTRSDLFALIGVEGYSEQDIRAVLTDFDAGQLREWLTIDTTQAEAEGKETTTVKESDLIDALQLWDEVTGKMLIEWGMGEEEQLDPESSYPCELWLIGNRVIRAVLNYDPLGRKPYYAASFEKIPGAFWGNGVPDLIRDCQEMCNATARALSNNMGIASGPQVGVNVSRLPTGEDPSQLFPWKIWQYQNTDYQDNSPPISFFQPPSNAQELLGVFEKFSQLADEYSGIPRYMTGEHAPGAGRTASGLSMLINNASKGLKQVISNIDQFCLTPLLERLYQHNLRYSQDPDLIGDVSIVAKGAMSLVAKEAAAVRRNEFLQVVLTNPVAQQIVGLPGTTELIRDAAKQLDMPVDKIVPTREEIEQMVAMQQQQQAMMMQAAMNPEFEQVSFERDDKGAVTGATKRKPKQLLPDGSQAGGRQQNLMVNRVTGQNGVGGAG